MPKPFDVLSWYRPFEPGAPVQQGDQLFDVTLHLLRPHRTSPRQQTIVRTTANVIVATQSCDLEQRKVSVVEIVPTYSIGHWLSFQPNLLNQLESVRRGHVPGLYLLPGWTDSPCPHARLTRIVPFDEKRTISWAELSEATSGGGISLRSPYIEHFGQALARFYMRVGLPQDVPEMEWRHEVGADEPASIPPTSFAEHGFPLVSGPLNITMQQIRLQGGPDVLSRAVLKQDGNFFGVGLSPDLAVQSLVAAMVARRAELSEEPARPGRPPHWLVRLLSRSPTT